MTSGGLTESWCPVDAASNWENVMSVRGRDRSDPSRSESAPVVGVRSIAATTTFRRNY